MELQPLVAGINATDREAEVISVLDGNRRINFSEKAELELYLQQFPEAENDRATRLFHYPRNCDAGLLVTLFEKFEFHRLGLVPRGLSRQEGSGFREGKCNCGRCKEGAPCGHSGLEFAIVFWQLEDVSLDAENRLEVTGAADKFSIFAGAE